MPPSAFDPDPSAVCASAGAHALPLPGAHVLLLPDCAVWWPERHTLFVADVHLGKAAVFRARGLPVPEATTGDTLARLTDLLHRHAARQLVLLGDFLHAREAHHPVVLQALQGWRAQHAGVAMTLVRGNHDSHAGDPPPWLGIDVVDEPQPLGPLAACHHPKTLPHATVLAGHWHPTVTLPGRGRDGLRLPCFHHAPGLLVLPAFGAFTGGHAAAAAHDVTRYAVGAGRVWALPRGA